MRQDNFTGRYIIKLGSSVILAVVNAVIQMMLPRAFSIEAYGFYSYNLNVFTSVVVMANLSASNAMIAKLSRRNAERGILKFYLGFFVIVSLMLNFGVAILSTVSNGTAGFFQGQTLLLVLLGLNAAVLNKLLSDTISMYDAMAISRFPAIMQIVLKIALCLLICIGYFIGTLNLYVFYLLQSAVTLGALFVMILALIKDHKSRYPNSVRRRFQEYTQEFWSFCKPLILVACWSQLNVIVMNWALMNYAGEVQQAIYGVALQLNVLLSYVFSPYAELMKREFAVIADDMAMLGSKLEQSFQQMFWVTAYFSVFTFVCADWIVPFLFGNKYQGAITVTRIMMVYTIYQAWGQVTGSYLLATEQTKKQAILSTISLVLTLGGIFLFQMPNILFKNGLGAEGIALNNAVCNFLSTLIAVGCCMDCVKAKKSKIVWIQLGAMGECLCAAILVKSVTKAMGNITELFGIPFVQIVVSGILYTMMIGMLVWVAPQQVGLSKELIRSKFRRVVHHE